MHPALTLTICIPTFNRTKLLGHTLRGLRDLERFGMPFEVVISDKISDNLSTDNTVDLVEEQSRSAPYIRLIRQCRQLPVSGGLINALYNARGRYIDCDADDDSVIPEALMNYVARTELECDLRLR